MNMTHVRRLTIWILVAGVIATALPWGLVTLGAWSYNNHDYTGAQTIWRVASYTSFYDRDAILLDIGDSQYQDHKFKDAAATFEEASHIAADSRFCMITYNWGRSLADYAATIEAKDKAGALTSYADALRTIAVQRCVSDADYRNQFEQLRQELLRKIAELTAAPSQQNQQPSSSDDSANRILDDHSGEIIQQHKYQSSVNYDQEDQTDSTRNFELVR